MIHVFHNSFPSLNIKLLWFIHLGHVESGSFILATTKCVPLFESTEIYLSSLLWTDTWVTAENIPPASPYTHAWEFLGGVSEAQCPGLWKCAFKVSPLTFKLLSEECVHISLLPAMYQIRLSTSVLSRTAIVSISCAWNSISLRLLFISLINKRDYVFIW